MAEPKYRSGATLALIATAVWTAGVAAIHGSLFVLPMNDAAIGDKVTCNLDGVWSNLPKQGANVFAEGALVYYDTTTFDFTSDAGERFVGHAVEAVVAGDALMKVRIHPNAHAIA